MQGDLFHSLCIHLPLDFSLLFFSNLYIFFSFSFSFLFPVPLCLFHSHCSAAIPLYCSLFPSLYSLPLFLFLPPFCFTQSGGAFFYFIFYFKSCPVTVIVSFVLKFTFHGNTQQNNSKTTCKLHKEWEDFK